MPFKLLNGAASPANCARKIPGPLMVLIVSSTPPCIYDELLRRAFFRRLRSQEQRHVRDVIGKHTPLQTLTRHNFLLHFRHIPQFDLPLGPDSPRRNRVDPYPERTKLPSQNSRQSGDRRLAHVVYGQAGLLEPPNNGTKIDNRASAKPLHLRRHGLRREEHVPQIHRDPLVPVRRSDLLHRVPVVVPRIIDEHSNVAQLHADFFDTGLQRGDIAQVASDEKWRRSRLFLNLSDQRPARVLRNIHEAHARPLPGETARERRTNPASPASNEDRFARKPRVPRLRSSARIHAPQPPRLRRDATLLIFYLK